jgi:predicted metal-dependent hydrolase
MIFDYNLVRSKRKSVAIQVDSDCNITVRAPLRISQKEIDKILLEKKSWLEKTIILQREKKKNIKEYSDDDIKLLRKKAKEILPAKVEYYAKTMQVEPASVKINSAKKRYGSCSGTNNLNFSLYLMDKDERFIDYVVVHELAHIRHHNHSKDFYRFIEQFMPDYKERMKL